MRKQNLLTFRLQLGNIATRLGAVAVTGVDAANRNAALALLDQARDALAEDIGYDTVTAGERCHEALPLLELKEAYPEHAPAGPVTQPRAGVVRAMTSIRTDLGRLADELSKVTTL